MRKENMLRIEGEAASIVWALGELNLELLSAASATVVTDHKPLVGLLKIPALERPLTPRLTRLVLKIQEYNVSIEYKEGRSHFVPDLLSRNPSSLPSDQLRDSLSI